MAMTMAMANRTRAFLQPAPLHRLLSSQPPSSDQNPSNEALISNVVSIVTTHRSKTRWNFLRKSLCPTAGLSPSEFSQVALRIKNNPHLALSFFLWSRKYSICSHNLWSQSTIIHILARSRLKSLAKTLIKNVILSSQSDGPDRSTCPLNIFQTLVQTYRSCDSAPFVFDLLILACLDCNMIDPTLDIARLLRSRSIYPTARTCNSIIRSVGRSRGPEAAFTVYKEVYALDQDGNGGESRIRVSPNLQTFNSLMLFFCREQQFERVEDVRIEMAKLGCDPNVFTYSVLINASCDDGRVNGAVELWDEMRVKGIEPDIVAYNTLIGGFCEMGEVVRAELLFQEMTFGGIEPTSATFEHLIRGYCKIDDVDLALVLYKDMRRRSFWPEAPTVDAVIGALCRMNRVGEGLEFLRNVMKRRAFFPSRATYEFLIKGFCDEGKMEEALKIQAEMVGKGFEPNLDTYSDFIDGYRKQGDDENVQKLRNEMFEMGLGQENEDE